MELNKKEFLKTELGSEYEATVDALDYYMCEKSHTSQWDEQDRYAELKQNIAELHAKCEVFRLAIKQFYGVEYYFTRTDDTYGVCTANEEDYLFQKQHKYQAKNTELSESVKIRKRGGR